MTLSALWSLAELARALNLRSLRALGLEQRERIYDAASAATGQRVYWAIARPGGVRGGIQFGEMRELLDWLRDAVEIWRVATAPKGALRAAAERADARQTQAGAAGKSTPSAGQPARDDARRLAPYDGYRAITLDWTPLDDLPDTVEVASCALRLATRLKLSADIMRVCAESLDDAASAQASAPLKAGQGSATIQTAHGPARVDVTLTGEQTIAQARLTTPCAAALEQAPGWLLGHTLADLPATLIGLNLCPSCADL